MEKVELPDGSENSHTKTDSTSVASTTEQAVEQKEESEHEIKKRKKKEFWGRVLTFIGLQISLFVAALDNTIVSTALPKIGSDFNEMSIVAWVATAYMITFDAFQPLFSKFSDIFGRKIILIFSLAVFMFGSVLCGAAQSMIMLIVARAIAGIGGAGIFSMVFIIFSDLVPLEERGKYQGIVNSVFALSSVFGPLIGGSFTDYVTWRWNFYINLPIGAAAIVVLFFFLKMPMPTQSLSEKLKRVDYVGTVIVLIFATLFLLALNFGGQTYPWKSAAVIVPLVIAVLMVGLLVLVESKFAKEPLMPMRLFRNRSVAAVLITNWFMGITFFSIIYYLPMYFQIVRGDSAMWSGIRLIPMQMVLAVLSAAVGFSISKFGVYRPFIWVGMAILTLWIGIVSAFFGVNTSWSEIYGITIVGAVGIGALFSSTIIALQASVAPPDIAVVTGLGNFTRVLGGALGVAISSAVLNSTLQNKLPEVLPPQYAAAVIASAEYIRNGLPEEYIPVTLDVYMDGLILLWRVLIPMCGLGFISSLFVKHHSVRSHKRFFEDKEKNDATNGETSKGQKDVSIEINKEEHEHEEVTRTVVDKSEIQKSAYDSEEDVKKVVVEEETKDNNNA
ncbi:MFS general substrate transporter [Backusella circina FSU 941]|nr:MFS general substrate transporter [Backusella circina FSU 941]